MIIPIPFQSPFVGLLQEAFHAHELPECCSISLALAENQDDYRELIAEVDKCDQREALISRLTKTHPVRRAHRAEHDNDFWNVWTEAQALAWASTIGGWSNPEFTDDIGKPDIFASPETWIEAKTIRRSPPEDAALSRMAQAGIALRGPSELVPPHGNLLRKFEDGLHRAITQYERQGTGNLIVFFNVQGIDWPTSQTTARGQITQWAQGAARRHDVRVVVCWYGDWFNPLLDASS